MTSAFNPLIPANAGTQMANLSCSEVKLCLLSKLFAFFDLDPGIRRDERGKA